MTSWFIYEAVWRIFFGQENEFFYHWCQKQPLFFTITLSCGAQVTKKGSKNITFLPPENVLQTGAIYHEKLQHIKINFQY